MVTKNGLDTGFAMIANLFNRAMPYVLGFGLPIALTLMTIQLPVVYDLKGELAKVGKDLEHMTDKLIKADAYVLSEVQAARGDLRRLLVRQRDAETDPKGLLAKHGIGVEPSVNLVWVDGAAYAFPKTDQAITVLLNAGYEKRKLTPYLYGYVQAASKPAGTSR